MNDHDAREGRAHFRFAIIGGLLAAPPARGELGSTISELATREWRDPVDGRILSFSAKTIEAWYYRAKNAGTTPVGALRRRVRGDRGQSVALSPDMEARLRAIRSDHSRWTMRLVHDELVAQLEEQLECPEPPSYSTTKRFMIQNGLKRKKKPKGKTTTEHTARETRRFEVDRVNALWHLDYHQGSRKVLTKRGDWVKP